MPSLNVPVSLYYILTYKSLYLSVHVIALYRYLSISLCTRHYLCINCKLFAAVNRYRSHETSIDGLESTSRSSSLRVGETRIGLPPLLNELNNERLLRNRFCYSGVPLSNH